MREKKRSEGGVERNEKTERGVGNEAMSARAGMRDSQQVKRTQDLEPGQSKLGQHGIRGDRERRGRIKGGRQSVAPACIETRLKEGKKKEVGGRGRVASLHRE